MANLAVDDTLKKVKKIVLLLIVPGNCFVPQLPNGVDNLVFSYLFNLRTTQRTIVIEKVPSQLTTSMFQ